MELRNLATLIALRSSLQCAWAMVRAARAPGDLGKALEHVADDPARMRRVDITDFSELLVVDAGVCGRSL